MKQIVQEEMFVNVSIAKLKRAKAMCISDFTILHLKEWSVSCANRFRVQTMQTLTTVTRSPFDGLIERWDFLALKSLNIYHC
jgi:hypothetical protein